MNPIKPHRPVPPRMLNPAVPALILALCLIISGWGLGCGMLGGQASDFGNALDRIARDFEQDITSGGSGGRQLTVVVRSFIDQHSQEPRMVSREIEDDLITALMQRFRGKSNFTILERDRIEAIEKEVHVETDWIHFRPDEWREKLGLKIGAGFLITGKFVLYSKSLKIHSRMMNIVTGDIVASSTQHIPLSRVDPVLLRDMDLSATARDYSSYLIGAGVMAAVLVLIIVLAFRFRDRSSGTAGQAGQAVPANQVSHTGQTSQPGQTSQTSQTIPGPADVGHLGPEVAHFAKLDNLQSPTLSIRVWPESANVRPATRDIGVIPKSGRGRYRIGDSIRLWFMSNRDCYLYCFNIGPTGNITRLLPNAHSSANRIQAQELKQFPDAGMDFDWVLQEPAGIEIIKVFATLEPVDMSRFLESGAAFARVNTRDIKVMAKTIQDLNQEVWAEGSCIIEVSRA